MREGIADAITRLVDEHPHKTELMTYMEPFAGMLNIMHTLVTNDSLSVSQWLASDINPDVVALLQEGIATGSSSFPDLDAFTEVRYEEHDASSKDTTREGNAERAFFGLATTWSNIWFNGWNSDITTDAPGGRPYKLANFRKGLDNLCTGFKDTGVDVECKNLFDRETPTNTIVYADPPYRSNTFDKNPYFK